MLRSNSISSCIIELIGKCGELPPELVYFYLPNFSRPAIQNTINRLKAKRLVTIVGNSKTIKTIRLLRPKGLQELEKISPELLESYLTLTNNHKFYTTNPKTQSSSNTLRRHRMAEVIALMDIIGASVGCDNEELSMSEQTNVLDVPIPAFYTSIELKRMEQLSMHKVEFTRFYGCLFCNNTAFLVYNIGNGVFKWSQQGEQKAILFIQDIINKNSSFKKWNIASIMLSSSYDVIFNSLNNSENSKAEYLSLFNVLRNIYCAEVNENGISILSQLLVKNSTNILKEKVFGKELLEQSKDIIDCDCDIVDGKTRAISFLSSNISRLKRFCDFASTNKNLDYEVFCYDFQKDSLDNFCPDNIKIIAT